MSRVSERRFAFNFGDICRVKEGFYKGRLIRLSWANELEPPGVWFLYGGTVVELGADGVFLPVVMTEARFQESNLVLVMLDGQEVVT